MKRSPEEKKHVSDALDWNEAMDLIERMYANAEYRDCLMIACGCYLGLRISDLLKLRWKDLTEEDEQFRSIFIYEQKTGKRRALRINPKLKELAVRCREQLCIEDSEAPVFQSGYNEAFGAITRQRAAQILNRCKTRYGIRSARQFSTHSLRKTFGRHVWQLGCDRGRGEESLLLLQDIFGHSSIKITKRYLGIRQEEILSVYDNL